MENKEQSIQDFIQSSAELVKGSGPNDHIVLTSRVRLARNIRNYSFPGHAKKNKRIECMENIIESASHLPHLKTAFTISMDKLSALEKQILVERHLISREHAAKGAGSALVFDKQESFSIMINEEDHLRMQSLQPGLRIQNAYETIDNLDSEMEEVLDYAFSDELGYLTACPTNLGTGIRVSAMLHLPGLVLLEQINQVIQAVNKLGLAVRGLYGEGTEALGNLFQVSNQMTLGESEKQIVERINKVLIQIIEHEENARQSLIEKKPKTVFNQIGRAYGILSNAYIISSKETMNLLSLLRLGVDLGLIPETKRQVIDELFLLTQPAHLQLASDNKLSADERDMKRAEMLRQRLAKMRKPSISKDSGKRSKLDKSKET